MLAVKNLERLMEIEADLKSQHQAELNSKDTQLTQAKEKQEALKENIAKLEATIAAQLEQIKELSANSSNSKVIEQRNRELSSQSSKLQEECSTQKKRIKALQKDLAAEREELKALKQLDPQKMKKGLDANKKKLAEKTSANELLQKTNNKLKKDNEELKKKLTELEASAKASKEAAETSETTEQEPATAE